MQVERRSNADDGLSETDGVLGALLSHDLLFGPDGDATLDLDEGELEDERALAGAAGVAAVFKDLTLEHVFGARDIGVGAGSGAAGASAMSASLMRFLSSHSR